MLEFIKRLKTIGGYYTPETLLESKYELDNNMIVFGKTRSKERIYILYTSLYTGYFLAEKKSRFSIYKLLTQEAIETLEIAYEDFKDKKRDINELEEGNPWIDNKKEIKIAYKSFKLIRNKTLNKYKIKD